MAFNLRKLAERAIAQANPFDGGKTAATVARAQAQQAPPARTPAQVPQRPAVAQRQAPSPSNNALLRGVSRGWNQINMLDNGRTWVNPTPTSDMSVKQQATRLAVDNVAKPIARSANTLAGAAVKGAQQSADIVNLGRESLLGTDNSYQQALNRATQRSNAPIQFSNNGGLLGAGTHFKTAQELDNPVKLASAAVTTGSDLASFVAPSMSLKAGFQQGGKTLVTKLVGANALDNAVNNVASQVNETGRVDPRGVAVSAALGVGMPVAGYGVGRAAKGVVDAGIAATRLVRNKGIKAPSPLNPSEVADLSNFRQTAGTGAIMDEGVYQRGVQAAQKAGIDYRDPTQVDNLLGAHRTFDTRLAQRNEALQRFKPQPLNEGGFAKVPSVDRNELQKIYRGQDTDKLDFSSDRIKLTPDYRGVAFSSDLEMAKPYGKNIVERYIPKNRVLKAKDIPAKDLEKLRNDWKRMSGVDDNNPFSGNDNDLFQQEYEINKILKIAQDQGKDAVDVADIYPFVAPEAEIRVINPGALQDLSKPTKNKLGLTKLNEGGYARIPGGTKDPAPDLSPQQKTFVNEYANMLKDMGQGNGVDIGVDGQRLSNNFRAPELKGKKMTEYDWFQQARKELESGKAAYGASDGYKQLPTAPASLSNNSRLQNPQQASPVSQLDNRTENIPQLNDTLLPDGAKPLPNRVPTRMSQAERDNLYQNVPEGTQRTIKVNSPNTERNIPVSQMTRDGDVMTATNVNPNIKKGEKRYSVDKDGELIEDRKGATSLFTDDEGRVKGFRVGKEYFDAKDLGDLSDVNGYGSMAATMRRNAERGFGKETGKKVSEFLVDHQQAQATKMIERHVALTQGLKTQAQELGINFAGNSRKAKNVSKAIQDFGEGNRTKADLVKEFGSDYADKIIKADKWFKSQYNALLDEMNAVLTQYGYDPVPKRKNYYTHFQEPKLWESFGLKMQELRDISGRPTMQDSNPMAARGQISNKLAGQSEFTAPNKRFNRFALRRTGDQYTSDAFKSFETYLSPTLNNIYMTPSIARARVLTRAIAQDADIMGKDANNIIVQTREWANRLAGKSNRLGDRVLSDSMSGQKILAASQWVQRKAGANTIVGNLSTAVMQPVVLTQTAGKFGYKNTLLGAMQEMSTAHAKTAPIRQSEFLRRRYADTNSVTASKKDIGGEVLNTPLKVVEQTAVRITWNAAYNDALAKGLKGKKAIQYADINTEKTVAGRSIGERPELYESKSAAMLTMYQLEVNNYWQQFGKEMSKTQAAKTLVAAYAFNLLLQQVTGRQVGFNPIDTAIETYKETQKEEKPTSEKAKSIGQLWAGEVVDNAPLVGPAINMVIGDQNMKKVFGPSTNVGRFGVGSPFSAIASTTKVKVGDKTVPIPQNVILPYAGNQVKKTVEGAQALWNQKMTDKKGDTTVNVPRTPANIARGIAFGPSAIPEVNKYYNNIGKKKYDQVAVPNQTVSKAGSQSLQGLTKDQQEQYQALPNTDKAAFKAEALAKNKVSRQNKAKGIKTTGQGKKTSKPSEKDYYTQKDAEYKDFKNKYDADKKAGKLTQLQDLERSRKLQKLAIGSKYDKEARDLWGKSKAIVSQYINSQPPDKAKSLTDQLTAYDRELYEAGLAKYATFKNGIAPVGRGRRAGSGRRSGGRRTARGGKRGGRGKKASGGVSKASLKQYMLSDITKQRGTQYKKLSDIVKRATISSKSAGSATGKKVALKKYTPKKGTVKRGNI